ncbi:MAG: hypothetical protein AAF466_13765 [Bacteroidota bacterium]
MEHKKDIGSRIEHRLKDANTPLETGLWERIEGSLDRRDRRKRTMLLLWISGGAAAILLFLLLLNTFGHDTMEPDEAFEMEEVLVSTVDSILSDSESGSEKPLTYSQLEQELGDSSPSTTEVKENEQPDHALKDRAKETKQIVTGTSKRSNKFPEEEMTVKTVYHYYNSATNEVIETTDKAIIDSLIEHGNKESDSVQIIETRTEHMKKKDSLF